VFHAPLRSHEHAGGQRHRRGVMLNLRAVAMRLGAATHDYRAAVPGLLMMLVGPRIGDALNFVYNLLLVRWLGEAQYGQAAAILSAIGIPSAALGVLICRETVWLTEANDHAALLRYVWRWFWRVGTAAALVGVGVIFLSPYVGTIFRYEHASTTYALAAMIVATAVGPLWGSVIQGQKRFLLLGSIPVAQGMVRVALTAALLYLGLQVTGVLYAQFLSMSFVIMWCVLAARKPVAVAGSAHDRLPARSTSLLPLFNNLVTTTALTSLMLADVVVVNFVFPGPMAGGYACVTVFGRIACYVPESLANILQPYLMRDHVQGRDDRWQLFVCVAIAMALAMAVALLFWLVGTPLFTWLRPAYVPYVQYLPVYVMAMGFLSVARLSGTYAMAHERLRAGIVLLAMAVLQIVAFYVFRQTLWRFVTVQVTVTALTAVLSLTLLQRQSTRADKR